MVTSRVRSPASPLKDHQRNLLETGNGLSAILVPALVAAFITLAFCRA